MTGRLGLAAAAAAILALGACDGGTGPDGPTVDRVIVDPGSLSLVPDEVAQMTVQVLDRNGDPMPGGDVSWSSSNPGVATIAANGSVTAVSVGRSDVTASIDGVSGRATVEVGDVGRHDATMVLDSTTYRLLSDSTERAAGTFRFQAPATAAVPEPGDVIVGAQGPGYLQRVVGASRSGDVLTVRTEHAALADAIKGGRLVTRATLDPVGGAAPMPVGGFVPRSGDSFRWGAPEVIPLVEGVEITPAGISLDNLTILEIDTCNQGSSECGRVKLEITEGQIGFTPTFDMDIELGWNGLKRAKVLTTGEFAFSARTRFSSEVTFSVPRALGDTVPLARYKHPWFAVVAGVPVQGSIEYELNAGIDWQIEGALGLETGLSHTTAVTLGTEYDGSSWREIAGAESNTDGYEPNWIASASTRAKLFVKPEVKAIFYETAGPTAALAGYFALDASVDLNRWALGASFGLDFALGAEAKIPVLDRTVAKFEKTWNWVEIPVFQREGEVFQLVLDPSSTSLAIGQSKLINPIALRHDGSEVAVTGTVQWQSSAPSVATVNASGLVRAVGPGSARITATTQGGSTADAVVDVLNVEAYPSASVFQSDLVGVDDRCAVAEVGVSVFDLNGLAVPPIPVGSASFADVVWEGGEVLTTSVQGTVGIISPDQGPFTAALLIDQSGSMASADPEGARLAAAKQFVGEAEWGDEFVLYSFASSVTRQTGLVSDEVVFKNAIDALPGAGGDTSLFDGVAEACQYVAGGASTNRAVVVLTDGRDTASGRSLEEALGVCRARGVRIFSVGFGGAVPEDLSSLSLGTGGSVVHDRDVAILLSAVRSLPSAIRGGQNGTKITLQACRSATAMAEGGTISGRVRVRLGASNAPTGLTHMPQSGATQEVSAPFFIDVPTSVVPVAITTTSLPEATLGVPYSAGLKATGGLGSYSWQIVSGQLPPGVELVGNALVGTPSSPGSWPFTVRVASGRESATRPFTMTVVQTATDMFATTTGTYAVDVDADAVCRAEFGNEYRNTDWRDIQEALASGMAIGDIRDPAFSHAWTKYFGQTHYSSSRRYFASLYPVHAGYAVHYRLDANGGTTGTPVIVMGSWYSSYHVSCTKW